MDLTHLKNKVNKLQGDSVQLRSKAVKIALIVLLSICAVALIAALVVINTLKEKTTDEITGKVQWQTIFEKYKNTITAIIAVYGVVTMFFLNLGLWFYKVISEGKRNKLAHENKQKEIMDKVAKKINSFDSDVNDMIVDKVDSLLFEYLQGKDLTPIEKTNLKKKFESILDRVL